MDTLAQNLIFVLVVTAAVAGAGLVYYLAWLRRKKIRDLAASLGLNFQDAGPEEYFLENTGLELFRCGYSRKASSLIQFSCAAGELRFFDYSYVTGHGKHKHRHSFTVALAECPRLQVPAFDLKPETFMYKLGEFLGFKDIDLPAFPLFSEKYRLTGTDEAAVHMFFTPERAAWFERNHGLRVQGARGFVLLFRREGLLPADAWQGFMEEAKIFAAEVLK